VNRALRWVVDHPALAGSLLLLATAVLATALPRLTIDESAEGLIVARDPAREFYEAAKRRFGGDTLTVVLLKADNVFTPAVLGAVKRLTEALERVESVSRVESLTTVRNIRGQGDTLDTEPLVGATVPTTPADLARLRADALAHRAFVGNLVSPDGRATAIVVYADPVPGDSMFNRRFAERVDALIAAESAPGLTIFQVGAPLTKATAAGYIKQDQRTVVPLAATVLLLTLLVAFRTFQGVVIPMLTALVSIVWGLALMALSGLPLTMLTAVVPSLLLAIGFTEDVHMISGYHHHLEQGADKLTALRAMVDHAATPILVTTVTTVVGFGSLITTDIPMLVQFGYASAMALTANWLVTLIGVPVLLRVWPVPRRLRPSAFSEGEGPGPLARWLEWIGRFNLRHRAPILGVWAALVALSVVGWTQLRINTDFISYFPERSPIRQRIHDLHTSLTGGLAFYIVVDTGRPDGLKDPALLRGIAALQDHLAATGKVDKTVSLADYLRKMHREMHGGDPAFEVIPETADEVAQYLLLLEGPELAKFVDFNASAANVVVRHNLTGSGELTALIREIEQFAARVFPNNVIVRPTGEEVLFNRAADFLAVNELTSFSLTFLIIGLIHAFLFTSLKAGLLSLVPNVVPILLLYGFMGFVGISLNTSTAMIATVAIGIAVDDTVHHMVTYSRQLNEHHDQKVAMFNTLLAQGRPIIYVSLALAAGFLTLTASQFVSTQHFGLLAALVMLVALAGELTLTPILMYSTRLVTLWDLVMLRMSGELVRRAPLLQDLSRWEARKIVLLGGLHAFAPGDLVIRKGDRATELYMVVTGSVRVFDPLPDGGQRTHTVLGPGGVIGEIALLTQDVRSASVVAEAPSELLRLDPAALEQIRRRYPYTGAKVFRNLARMLGERLRETTAAAVGDRAPAPAVPGVRGVPPGGR
jgi:predicted RND superfamily exporter protein